MKKVVNITVAVPTLDRPEALSRCLEGVFKSEILPAEVLIIDQGQSSAAQPVIDHFQSNSTPIHYYRQLKKGLSAARNLATAQANYEIIAFTDDDCVPDPAWIGSIHQTFASFPTADGVAGRILPLGEEVPGRFAISLRSSNEHAEFHNRALPWRVGSGGNFAVKREWLASIGGYDERLGAGSPGKAAEDMDLFHRLLQAGAIIRYEPQAVIYHERQDITRLLLSCWNYAYGIGAFCAKYLRRGDPYAAYILGVWLHWLFREIATLIRHRNKVLLRGRLLSLRGCTHGLAYGFKLE